MILWRVLKPNRFHSTFTTLVTLPVFSVVFYTLTQGSSDNISLVSNYPTTHRIFFNITSSGLLRLPTSASLPRALISAFTASSNSQVTGNGTGGPSLTGHKTWLVSNPGHCLPISNLSKLDSGVTWLLSASWAKDTITFFSIPPPLC